jgi:hypothetical protein
MAVHHPEAAVVNPIALISRFDPEPFFSRKKQTLFGHHRETGISIVQGKSF